METVQKTSRCLQNWCLILKCSTWYSFPYLLNFYETVTLKGLRPESNICTEYNMENISQKHFCNAVACGVPGKPNFLGKKDEASLLLN